MGSLAYKIIDRIVKHCNKPTGILQSCSIPISESRYPEYYHAQASERLKCHTELKYIAQQVQGFSTKYHSKGFGDIPLLNRIEVKDCICLMQHMKIPVLSDQIMRSCKALEAFDEPLPKWTREAILTVSSSWREGKSQLGCKHTDIERVIDILKFVSHCHQDTEGVTTDMRTISVDLYKDSKRLELIVNGIAAWLKLGSPPLLGEANSNEVLEYWGVSRLPQPFQFKADLTLVSKKGQFNTQAIWPFMLIPPDGILEIHILKLPSYLIFIENKTTFERYCREIDDSGWVFYTHGFPSRKWQKLYVSIVNQLAGNIPIYHWGDMDVGGYRILAFMNSLLARDIKPYKMFDLLDNGSKKIELTELINVLEGIHSPPIRQLYIQVKELSEKQKHVYWVEQESLQMESPEKNDNV